MEILAVFASLVADFDVTRFSGGARIEWTDETHMFVEVSGSVARSMRAELKPHIAADRCQKIRVAYTDPPLISMPEFDEDFCVFFADRDGSLGLASQQAMVREGEVTKEPWTHARFQNGVLEIRSPAPDDWVGDASPGVCGEYHTRRGGVRTRCSFKLPREWLR